MKWSLNDGAMHALDIKVLTIEFGSKLWSFNKEIFYAVDSMDLFMDV